MQKLIYDIFFFVIPSHSETHVLVQKTQEPNTTPNYSLPHVRSPRFTCDEDLDHPDYNNAIIIGSWNGDTDALVQSAQANLCLDLYIRDIVWHKENDSDGREKHRQDNVLLADLRGDTVLISTLLWMPFEQVKCLGFPVNRMELPVSELIVKAVAPSYYHATHVKPVDGSFNTPCQPSFGPKAQSNPSKQPWRICGWITEIETWFTQALLLQSLRISPGASLTQVRNMRYSSVLRCQVQSTHGSDHSVDSFDVFLKSSSPSSAEALITKAVASHFPEIVPRVLATRDNHTFVQIGVECCTFPTECEIMRALADMQIRSVDCISSLRSAGVPYRGLDWHASRLADVLQNPVVKSFEGKEFYRSLIVHLNDFQSLLAELASYNIPHALVHGDFHYENIAVGYKMPESPQFIDWASACIGYPLLDLYRISTIEFDGIRDKSALEIYMKAWGRFECPENIERALQIANVVMISDNLHVVLEQYVSGNHVERPEDLFHVENCMKRLSRSIEGCLRDRNSNSDVAEGTNCIIITKNDGLHVLVENNEDNSVLPTLTCFGISRLNDRILDGHGLRQVVRAQLAVDTRVVREIWTRDGRKGLRKEAIVLEITEPDDLTAVPGRVWMNVHELRASKNFDPEDNLAIQAYINGKDDPETISMNPPWRQFGWLMRTRNFLHRRLREKGVEIRRGPREVKTDVQSTVWKCQVKERGNDEDRQDTAYNLFLKSSNLGFSEEELLSVMSSFSEGLVPSIVAKGPQSDMFVMTDAGHIENMDTDTSLLLAGLSQLQKSSLPYFEQLRKVGLPEYSCSWVKQNANLLLEKARSIAKCHTKDVAQTNVVEVGDVVRHVEELDFFRMPLTLVHGDFQAGNIGSEVARGHMIFDWGSAFLGHPLADVAVWVRTSGYASDEDAAVQSYHPQWQDYIPQEADFRRAIDHAFVYYWLVNLDQLLRQMNSLPATDHMLIIDRICCSLVHLWKTIESNLTKVGS